MGGQIQVFSFIFSSPYISDLGYADLLAGDHVDILGRASLNELVLRVASGHGDDIEETFVSRIKEYADKIQVFEE